MGRFLGDLTNELPEGDYIEEFVVAGPENYAYRLAKSGKTVCPLKGFTVNWKNYQLIIFDSIKAIVKDCDTEQTIKIVNNNQITRDLNKMKIVNKDLTKKYRMVYDKRILIDNFHTVPYGYVDAWDFSMLQIGSQTFISPHSCLRLIRVRFLLKHRYHFFCY